MVGKYELLAPAGNFKSLVAAVNAGAGAVYFGLQEFNMRFSAQNFKISDLNKINKICRKKNIKKYLTLNTIIYDEEFRNIEKIIKKVKGNVDAIICWDLSIIRLCRKYKIPFHISTQASVANTGAAKFYKKIGAERIILARELNIKQIKKIAKIIDVECFVHGAMCVAVSGRCFTSQFLHNKSANRGECLQPCRREYTVKDDAGNELRVDNNLLFSAKDLCALPFIDKLKKAGVRAFKIEGRNKDPEYVDTVVRIYRKALDKKLNKEEIKQCIEQLKKVYNKGFSSGFYLHTPTADDFSKVRDSQATEKKQFIGKVEHYWSKQEVAAVKISAAGLQIKDKILIIGNKTGVKRVTIESMEISKRPRKKAKKGDRVGIKLPRCRKGDEVYKVIGGNLIRY